MYIKPKANAESLWDINEDVAMEAVLYPANDEVPCPWDADIQVDGNEVTIVGGVGPSGFGKCTCTLPVNNFDSYYKLEIPDGVVSDMMSDNDIQALFDAGWERA